METRYTINDKEFNKKIEDSLKQVKSLKPAFIGIAREFYKANKAIFALKGPGVYPDFKGPIIAKTWKEPGRPKQRTRNGSMTPYQFEKNKQVGGKGYPLLRLSGKLERSITKQGDQNAIEEITDKSIVLGTRISYASFHQLGTKNIPMREFLFLDPSTTVWGGSPVFSRRNQAWLKAIESYVFRTVTGNLGGSNG